MPAIVQATTPTFVFAISDASVDLTATTVYVTFTQGKNKVTKTSRDSTMLVERNSVTLSLEQSDTVPFTDRSTASVQMNWVYPDGSRGATETVELEIAKNLLPEVL